MASRGPRAKRVPGSEWLGVGVGVLADTFGLISQNSFIFPSSFPHPLTLLRILPKHFKSKIISSD